MLAIVLAGIGFGGLAVWPSPQRAICEGHFY
jgi:hypothetical protein